MYGLAKIAGMVGTIPTEKEEVKQHLAKRKEQEKKNKEVHNYLKQNYPEECLHWVPLVDWKDQNVSLKNIQMARRPGGAREMDKVKGIAEAVKQGKPMEAVVLVKTPDGKIKIADGYHRTLGHDHAGKKMIKAVIANVPDNKGPWDKEMHEKKLNVGKKAAFDLGLAGLEKEASLLGLLGLGTAFHVAPNLAMKAIKSTQTGQKALTGMFSAGVDMGRQGLKLHPNAQSFMEYGIGPESIVEYQLGKSLGSRISHMPPERQERFINKAKGMTQSYLNQYFPEKMNEIEKVPVLGSVKHYFDGKGENRVKNLFMKMSVPEEQKTTLKNHLGNAAMLGGAAAVNPHTLIQPILSGTRKQIAKSSLGGKIFDSGFKKGNSGIPMSKAKETMIDMAVSPSVLDPYRMGKSMKEMLPKPVNNELSKRIDIGGVYKNLTEG